MREAKQILKMDLINLFTNPMWLFYNIGFSIALVLILGFLSHGGYGDDITSYDYYGVALMLYAIMNTATISANCFMEERIKNGNMRVIYSPVPSFYLYFSKIAASFIFSAVCHILVGIVLHLGFSVNYGGSFQSAAMIILLMLLTEFFAAALGVFLCCVLKSEGAVNQILSLVITVLAILGGMFFSLEGLGGAMAAISNLSPLKWIMVTAFQVIYDHQFAMMLPVCLLLAVICIVLIVLSHKLFHEEDYLL